LAFSSDPQYIGRNLLETLEAPKVTNVSENTTWPTSADSTVASPTAVMATLLETAWPNVCEPMMRRRIAEDVNAANNSTRHKPEIRRMIAAGILKS
jgi:hypothetical protein